MSILISVLQAGRNFPILGWLQSHFSHGIDAPDVYLAQVEHRPTELLPLRISHNFVVHRIVIAIHL
ncbi:Uncharacterised protein [Segatella copri]|nr:Uncharacterised protein [Segatella copri]